MSLIQNDYKNGDKDSPCMRPILLLKKFEKTPLNLMQHLICEYMDLLILSNFPVTPHFTSRNHNFICETQSKAFFIVYKTTIQSFPTLKRFGD